MQDKNKIIIEAGTRGNKSLYRELLAYKDLFFILANRDFKVRYVQTFFSFFWAFVKPSITLLVLFFVFKKAIRVDTGDVPYPLYAICGMSAWTYFSYVLSQSGNAVLMAQRLIKKIYFPLLILPLSKALVGFIDFAIVMILVVVLLLYYQIFPGVQVLYLPLFFLSALMAALGVGIWGSALSIRYRDFKLMIPFLVQFGFFITPVAYSGKSILNNISETSAILYYLNPMAGVVEGFRWSLLPGQELSDYAFISIGVSLILFFSSIWYFRRVEKIMPDII